MKKDNLPGGGAADTRPAENGTTSGKFVEFAIEGIRDDLIVYFFVYSNIIVTLVLWLCYFGLDVESAIRSVAVAIAAVTVSILGFRWAYQSSSLWLKHAVAVLLIISLEISIVLTLVFNPVFFERTGLIVAASFFVGIRFATLPLVARTITILVVVSLVVTSVPLVSAWLRSDLGVVPIPLLAGTQISAFIIGILGFWIIFRRQKEHELRHQLSELSDHLYRDNRALEKAIDAERAANLRAEQETANRGRLLSYIVHDVRQPISALSYMLFSLQRQVSRDEGVEERALEECQACVKSAKTLIDDIVALERSHVTTPSAQLQDIELSTMFEQLMSEFGARFEESGIDFRVDETDAIVRGDALSMLRILRNLLTNAIKHSQASEVRMKAVKDGDFHLISVSDNGIGYRPPEDTLLERRAFNESGIGLKITERLASAMQSHLEIEAQMSGGTCCRLKVPTR